MPDEAAQQQSFLLANVVPQTARLNRGAWEGIEDAVRHLAERDGSLYVVTGPTFAGTDLKAIGPDRVLVPTSTWKAVYIPGEGAGAYSCTNTARPVCHQESVAALARETGAEPFPALSAAQQEHAIALPQPEASPYGHGGHSGHRQQGRSLLDEMLR